MTKAPIDIIAEHIPAFGDCFVGATEVKIPSQMRLTKAAAKIMAALSEAGFEIVRKDRE
jgi:hypothetical protein